VACPGCGAAVVVPDDFSRAKIRCEDCGYYAPVPEKLRSRAAEPDDVPPTSAADVPPRPGVARPVKARPKPRDASPDDDAGPPLLRGSAEEEDVPYSVPGDGTKKCPECRKELAYSATFCVHCGTDLITGEKPKKKFKAYDKTWESRLSMQHRLMIFGGLSFVNMLFALAIASAENMLTALVFIVVQLGLQAFLLGTYETVSVKRTAKGKLTVAKFWRVFFLKQPTATIAWEEHQGIGVVATHEISAVDWITLVYFIFCLGCVPAIIFYIAFLRPDRMKVAFCDIYGSTNLIVFHTTKREDADEIARLIADGGNLQFRPVL
jgi:DNA-directed RNA polymerase subunit M/transcription elongation factor TFIIS